MKQKRPRLLDGLRDGAEAADLPGLGAGIGDGLDRVRYAVSWLSGGRLPVRQPCPIADCKNGPFSTLGSLRGHLERRHQLLSERERTEACETARILARKAVEGARTFR